MIRKRKDYVNKGKGYDFMIHKIVVFDEKYIFYSFLSFLTEKFIYFKTQRNRWNENQELCDLFKVQLTYKNPWFSIKFTFKSFFSFSAIIKNSMKHRNEQS